MKKRDRQIDIIIGLVGISLTVLTLLFGDDILARFGHFPIDETPIATSLPPAITDVKSMRMILIIAGEFLMGSNLHANESPTHVLYIDDYYIDLFEVTNRHYRVCEIAGVCAPPLTARSFTRESYYGNPDFDDHPVVNVDRNMAKTYCEWREARLPTEAEWEKAARGKNGQKYPWGELIDPTFANYSDPLSPMDTTAVGKYTKGVSPFGLYDMAGNVWEWVSDSYSDIYQDPSISTNVVGVDGIQYGEIRGGSWNDAAEVLRTSARYPVSPNYYYFTVGFRCARSVP
jgi:formylglycine-generating enzyme required for sulfatase activity